MKFPDIGSLPTLTLQVSGS